MSAQYAIALSADQRQALKQLIATGSAPAVTLAHARILLKADSSPGGPAWKDAQIAEAVEVHPRTVLRVRQRFLTAGLDAALHRRPRHEPPRTKLDGAAEAHLIALVCGPPPAGQARWSLRLTAARWLTLDAEVPVSRETIRRTLKKTSLSPG